MRSQNGARASIDASAATEEPAHRAAENREWLARLRAAGAVREEAVAELYELLLRAARFEVARRRPSLPHLRGGELDDVAAESAADAVVGVLAKLDDFRGASRFTTWAYKFALLEAAVKLRRRAWQGREVPMEPESWSLLGDPSASPHEEVEDAELLSAVRHTIATALTPHRRKLRRELSRAGVDLELAGRGGTS